MTDVSVIIPAYNAGAYLHETMISALKQENVSLEVIVVDDGSTDNTSDIIKEFEQKDSRVKGVRQSNLGVSAARNNGSRNATGDYYAFLDADDILLESSLYNKLTVLRHLPEKTGMVHCDMRVIDGTGEPTGEVISGRTGQILEDLLLWNGCSVPGPSSILVKRSVFEDLGGFDEELSTAADQDFFFRLAEKYDVHRIPETLGLYRIHENNMHGNIALMEKDHLLVYDKARKRGAFKSFWFKRRCFANLYLILAGSWWKNARNKPRGMRFMAMSVLAFPPVFFKIIMKVFR